MASVGRQARSQPKAVTIAIFARAERLAGGVPRRGCVADFVESGDMVHFMDDVSL
jgi:hypothetical protein